MKKIFLFLLLSPLFLNADDKQVEKEKILKKTIKLAMISTGAYLGYIQGNKIYSGVVSCLPIERRFRIWAGELLGDELGARTKTIRSISSLSGCSIGGIIGHLLYNFLVR